MKSFQEFINAKPVQCEDARINGEKATIITESEYNSIVAEAHLEGERIGLLSRMLAQQTERVI